MCSVSYFFYPYFGRNVGDNMVLLMNFVGKSTFCIPPFTVMGLADPLECLI
jgi:hypothetical protein